MRKQNRHPEPSSKGLVAQYKLWAGLTSTAKVFDYAGGFTGIPTGTDIAPAYPGFKFNGSDDDIAMASGPTGVKTVAVWVNPDSIAGNDFVLDLNATNFIAISTGTLSLGGFADGQIRYVDGVTGTSVSTNWHLITATVTTGINATAFFISNHSSSFFTGKIGEVMLYNRTLSPSEVKSIYELTKWRYPNT